MSLKIKYVDAPIGAQEDATSQTSAAQPFGADDQIVSGANDVPWTTLEPFSWKLDGSRVALDEAPNNIGWWSKDRTDDNGRFSTPPVITISFSDAYVSTGITFVFWPSLNQWCDEIEVTWYNENTVLDQKIVNPDSPNWFLENAVEGFNKIVVTILKTNVPGQFAKIQQIQIGRMIMFSQDEIVRVSLLNEIDPSLCALSVDTMKVEILEKKGRTIIPQKNQAMYLYRNDKQIAAQYISDYSRENAMYYTFSCQSAIGRLETDFMGGIYENYPVEDVLKIILNGFKTDYSEFSDAKITGYLPVCTKREALQQIAFAIGAVVTTQGDGTIRLSKPKHEIESEFTGANIFSGAKITKESKPGIVQLASHSYVKGSEEEILLENEDVSGTDVIYVFDEPHYDYFITGGFIEDSGVNWVSITANAKVTLAGKKYVHSTSVKTLKNQHITAFEQGNALRVSDATLIHEGNAEEALNRLYNFSALTNLLTENVVVSDQSAGQIVRSENPWGSFTVGYITSMESDFTNTGHTANVTIRGEEERQ